MAWPLESLWERLEPEWPGLTFEVRAEVDSTNARLVEQGRDGDVHPSVLVAERQTAGRGRRGRAWLTEADGALLLSVGLPLAPQAWSGLSLAVGVAVAEALHPDVRIKWPNDLWTWAEDGQPRKLGGILIETGNLPAGRPGRWVVIGLGLNVASSPTASFEVAPARLDSLCPGLTPATALEQVLPALLAAVRSFEVSGFAAFADRFAARDALRGRPLRVVGGDGSVLDGLANGVSESGELLLRGSNGETLALNSAEVSVRAC